MECCAVIDTNVVIAALLSQKNDTATVRAMHEIFGGRIIPLYHADILLKYGYPDGNAQYACRRR